MRKIMRDLICISIVFLFWNPVGNIKNLNITQTKTLMWYHYKPGIFKEKSRKMVLVAIIQEKFQG